MCQRVLVDSSALSVLAKSIPDASPKDPLIRWFQNRNGILCYTLSGKFAEELATHDKLAALVASWRRIGETREIPADALRNAKLQLDNIVAESGKLRSNDAHVLEATIAGNIQMLITNDEALKVDFKCVMRHFVRDAKLYPIRAKERSRRAFLNKNVCTDTTR